MKTPFQSLFRSLALLACVFFVACSTPGGSSKPLTAPAPQNVPFMSARCVITALPGTYAGNGTGALVSSTGVGAITSGECGGVTLAAGDLVFLAPGATNMTHDGGATSYVDEGPWLVVNPGSTGDAASNYFSLARPGWWQHGQALQMGAGVAIGGEDTLFQGSVWYVYAAQGSAVVDTNDPIMYPNTVAVQVTIPADSGVRPITNVPLRSTSKTTVIPTLVSSAGDAGSTVGFEPFAITAGYLGTATVSVKAVQAGMTINKHDNSVLNVRISN